MTDLIYKIQTQYAKWYALTALAATRNLTEQEQKDCNYEWDETADMLLDDWPMVHQQIAELEQQLAAAEAEIADYEKLIDEANKQITAAEAREAAANTMAERMEAAIAGLYRFELLGGFVAVSAEELEAAIAAAKGAK